MDEGDDMYIFHATSSKGMTLTPFSRIKHRMGDFCSKFVIRHLEFERTEELKATIEKFVSQAYSCKFKLKPNYIV